MKQVMLAIVLLVASGGENWTSAQQGRQQDSPAVIAAVAPSYLLMAVHSHATGEVVVTVRLAADGSVISSELVSGNSVLAAGTLHVARRWKFAPATNKDEVRSVRLTFVYRLLPRGTPADELLPIFKPPYRVDVTQVFADERPLP